MSGFQQAKLELVDLIGVAKDALHVHVGLFLMLLFCLLSRRSLADWRALALVVAAALAGEAWDLLDTARAGDALVWRASLKDVANTIFWPAILFSAARAGMLDRRKGPIRRRG